MAFPTDLEEVREYQEQMVRKYLKDPEKIHCWGSDPKAYKVLELLAELLLGKDRSAVNLISDTAYAHAPGTLRYSIDMLLEAYLKNYCDKSESTHTQTSHDTMKLRHQSEHKDSSTNSSEDGD